MSKRGVEHTFSFRKEKVSQKKRPPFLCEKKRRSQKKRVLLVRLLPQATEGALFDHLDHGYTRIFRVHGDKSSFAGQSAEIGAGEPCGGTHGRCFECAFRAVFIANGDEKEDGLIEAWRGFFQRSFIENVFFGIVQ